jgi:hypothetical protein
VPRTEPIADYSGDSGKKHHGNHPPDRKPSSGRSHRDILDDAKWQL